MDYFFISNSTNGVCYNKWFKDVNEGLQWIENTLDLSLNWTITRK